jgi:hypothetical protein
VSLVLVLLARGRRAGAGTPRRGNRRDVVSLTQSTTRRENARRWWPVVRKRFLLAFGVYTVFVGDLVQVAWEAEPRWMIAERGNVPRR